MVIFALPVNLTQASLVPALYNRNNHPATCPTAFQLVGVDPRRQKHARMARWPHRTMKELIGHEGGFQVDRY